MWIHVKPYSSHSQEPSASITWFIVHSFFSMFPWRGWRQSECKNTWWANIKRFPLETGHPWNLSLLIIECDKAFVEITATKRGRWVGAGKVHLSPVNKSSFTLFHVFVLIYSPLSGSWNDTSASSCLSRRTPTLRIHAPRNKALLFCLCARRERFGSGRWEYEPLLLHFPGPNLHRAVLSY